MKKTIIVIGSARSGTSVLAGILHHIGVNMNPKYNPHPDYPFGSFEDESIQNFTRLLYNSNKDPDYRYIQDDIATARLLIDERDEADMWGFKSTLTHYCLDAFMPYLRGPHIISISRNILDHASSIMKHFRENYGRGLTMLEAMEEVKSDQEAVYTALNRFSDVPQFHIEYERIQSNIIQSAVSISRFLDITVTDEMNQKIIGLYVSRENMKAEYKRIIEANK